MATSRVRSCLRSREKRRRWLADPRAGPPSTNTLSHAHAGIGLAAALGFARVAAASQRRAKGAVAAIEVAGGQGLFVRAGVAVEDDAMAMVAQTVEAFGNALAETMIGLFRTEVIHRCSPWRGREDVEIATLEWVWWFYERRLTEPLGYLPPAEYEDACRLPHSPPTRK